jgi:adenosylmethionine-8-amino-7-oxononanoate aminotransferase
MGLTRGAPSPVWCPFTQHGIQPEAIAIAVAEGVWLATQDGGRILDAIRLDGWSPTATGTRT